MRFLLLFIISCIYGLKGASQYKNDNQVYKTIYPANLCNELQKNMGFLLLDVRSPGEYADTSPSKSLNLGHLKGARNMDIQVINTRLNEISGFRNKPVFVYCSHSQRSRRVSKMLADSGFTHVINVNGGLTAIHLLPEKDKACLMQILETQDTWSILSPAQVCNKLTSGNKNVFLLDVRPDSAWNHQLTNARYNAYGSLKGSKHIALATIDQHLDDIPRDKEIVIVDLNGSDAAVAAQKLGEKGYDKVSVLMEGLDRWMTADKSNLPCLRNLYEPAVAYQIIGATDFFHLYPKAKDLLILDVRSKEEFSNTHSQSFRNMGHIKNARNIPLADFNNQVVSLDPYRNSTVVLYDFANGQDTYKAADILTRSGFSKVYVLSGGIFSVRWSASNVPGMMEMHQWVEDVPEENR